MRNNHKQMAFRFLYSIIGIAILLLGEHFRLLIKVWTGRTFKPLLGLVFIVAFPVLMGLLLALPKLFSEWKKQGRWRYDSLKLVVGIPALYIILAVRILWIPILQPLAFIYPIYWRLLIMQSSIMNVAGIAVGYMILSVLYKEGSNHIESVE